MSALAWLVTKYRTPEEAEAQIAPREAQPGKYFWCALRGVMTIGSGLAPTLNAAKHAAEHFAQRCHEVEATS